MSDTKKKILITGGLGFIGCQLANRLSEEPGTELLLIDNLARGRMDDEAKALIEKENVRFLQGDLTDPTFYEQFGTGYEAVYHFAAVVGVKNVIENPDIVIRINALATLHLLDWFVAGGGDSLMFPSTSEAYAWTRTFHELPIPTPEDVPLAVTNIDNPRTSYAGSKIFGELAVTHYCAKHNKRFAIVRYHNVYGPRMGTSHVIPQLYQRAVIDQQNPLTVYSIEHLRAFCYIDDAVEATIATMRKDGANGQTFNIGNDEEETKIGDLAAKIMAVGGVEAPIESKAAENDPINRRCPDLSKARELLDYQPKVTLEEGLRRTCAWYKEFYNEQG